MIFFEGTEFSKSIGIPISGQSLAAEDIIVVTVNYRLNVFGFLCLGIPEARGNSGLLDQYFAILWVKRNIYRFGGDVEKITLFGYSSGAAGTMLHLTSPRTNGKLTKRRKYLKICDIKHRFRFISKSDFSFWQSGFSLAYSEESICRF